MKAKTIVLIVALAVIIGAIYYLESLTVSTPTLAISPVEEKLTAIPNISAEKTSEVPKPIQPPFKAGKYPLAPELAGISGYINTPPGTKISDFRGKVVLVDFWTYTCINCLRTLPFLTDWDTKYREKGLVIIGVHSPEFEFEKKIENVLLAVEQYGIRYPVVQDNDHVTWAAYQNRFWPHKYLIDAEGYIRYDHIGEGAYAETEKRIQELLTEIHSEVKDMNVSSLPDETPRVRTTPELYAGYAYALPRGENIGNPEGLKPGEIVDYTLNQELQRDVLHLQGKWKSNPDHLEAQGRASVFLDFTAAVVNIVAAAPEQVTLDVLVNGEPIARDQAGSDVRFEGQHALVVIQQPRLYQVVKGPYGHYVLELRAEKGFTFNAFTFG